MKKPTKMRGSNGVIEAMLFAGGDESANVITAWVNGEEVDPKKFAATYQDVKGEGKQLWLATPSGARRVHDGYNVVKQVRMVAPEGMVNPDINDHVEEADFYIYSKESLAKQFDKPVRRARKAKKS